MLEEVQIDGDFETQNNKQISLSVQTVDKQFLEKYNGNSLMVSLERIPGITSINLGSNISKPVIRGLAFNRVIVNHGGIKQEGQQWGADHGLEIDQYDVEKVEIVKGASSLQYGSDGMGGIINLLPHSIPRDSSFNAKITSVYKSNNDLYGINGLLTGNMNGKYIRIGFSHQQFADYRVPATEFTYNTYKLPIYNLFRCC